MKIKLVKYFEIDKEDAREIFEDDISDGSYDFEDVWNELLNDCCESEASNELYGELCEMLDNEPVEIKKID